LQCIACPQVIYGCQKLATCSIDAQDMGPNGNSLGVMITLRMRLHCAIVRAGQTQPEQVRLGKQGGGSCGGGIEINSLASLVVKEQCKALQPRTRT
jgi:hypothetical protein